MDDSMKVLVDGDVLAYRCLAAATKTEYHLIDDDNETVGVYAAGRDPETGQTGKARADAAAASYPLGLVSVVKHIEEPPIQHVGHLINEVLDGIRQVTDQKTLDIYLSSPDKTWRHEIYPEYKANRPPKPPMIEEVRQMLFQHYNAVTSEYEADDLISMHAYGYTLKNEPWVIVSVDKDFLQIPGLHLNPFAAEKKIVEVTPQEAEFNLWVQVIAGDSVDNIKGIPGVGVKGAQNWLMDEEEMDYPESVLFLYEQHELGAEDMLLTYKLVKLLQNEFETDSNPDWYEQSHAIKI